MKLLILGLFPVLIFWLVEDKFGTFWGLVAAMVWAIAECGYEYFKNRKVEKLTLFSTGLVVLLGGIGLWLDNSILFKFQPVIVEVVFSGILYLGGRSGEPVMLKLAKQSRPEIFIHQNPQLAERQKQLMVRMTRNLIVLLILHSGLLSYLAFRGTTGQWAFWKGIGFNVFLILWVISEFGIMRFRVRRGQKKSP